MEMPNLMVFIKIGSLYPDNITRVAIQDETTLKWSCALLEFKDNVPGDIIYGFDDYIYDTDKEALSEMNAFLNIVIETMKIMSN
jgi:hypothetical protein